MEIIFGFFLIQDIKIQFCSKAVMLSPDQTVATLYQDVLKIFYISI